MNPLSAAKTKLLDTFADGQERGGWMFGAGTLSWAKKAGYVAMTHESPRRYTITDAGRSAHAQTKGRLP